MSISNFSNLLKDVLDGKHEAIVNWGEYVEAGKFDKDEFNQTHVEIKDHLSIKHRFLNGIKDRSSTEHFATQFSYALYLKAYMYEYGLGIAHDEEKAINFYNKAIEKGNTYAMNRLASMHKYKDGLDNSTGVEKAIKLYEEAIGLGNASAMVNRAYMHLYGDGGPKDEEKAIRLYDRAIELNDVIAMEHRAYMHINGLGGEKNYKEAAHLYDKAILLGRVQSIFYRAKIYEKFEKNDFEAMNLYKKAIKLGLTNKLLTEARSRLVSLQKRQEEQSKADERSVVGTKPIENNVDENEFNDNLNAYKKIR